MLIIIAAFLNERAVLVSARLALLPRPVPALDLQGNTLAGTVAGFELLVSRVGLTGLGLEGSTPPSSSRRTCEAHPRGG